MYHLDLRNCILYRNFFKLPGILVYYTNIQFLNYVIIIRIQMQFSAHDRDLFME